VPDGPPQGQAEAAPEEATDQVPAGSTLPHLLKTAGAVLGSTTVLTGLLFYFGRLHITGFYRYLRVNFTVLDFTANDYLIRSADGLFVPVTAVAVLGLLALAAHRQLTERTPAPTRERLVRRLAPACAATGGFLVLVALVELFTGWSPVAALPWAGGVALAGGGLLLAYAVVLARTGRPRDVPARRTSPTIALAEGGLVLLLVTIGLFWAVGNYAIEVGEGRARETVAGLPRAADAVLYTERSLRLAVAGVTEVGCEDAEAAFRFRYDGLKLVLQSGNQYLLLPVGWTRANGTAVLVPRGDSVRIEFAPPGQQRSEIC
jgi:hypothetical protein